MLHFFINQSINSLNIYQTLFKVPGLGFKKINYICKQAGLLKLCKWIKLTEGQIKWLSILIERSFVGNNSVFFDFRKKQENQLNSLKSLKNYRGMRLSNKLPVNGQNTHSNAKTVKRLN